MNINEMKAMLATGRYQAIVKNVAGRRFFVGVERKSKRSRKRHEKYMCPPQDLDQLLAKHAKKKEQAEEPASPSDASAPDSALSTPSTAPTATPDQSPDANA